MKKKESRDLILKELKKRGKCTNRDLIRILGGDEELYHDIREDLILNDLAKDKKGVGLIYSENNPTKTFEADSHLSESHYWDNNLQILFISYGRQDASEIAWLLHDNLSSLDGVSGVWMDQRNIKKDLWDRKIEEGIESCTVFLALISPCAVRKTSVCRDETVYAFNQGKPIIPLYLGLEQNNQVPLLLCRRNWIDFALDPVEGVQKLKKYLAGDESVVKNPLFPVIAGIEPLDFGPEIASYTQDFKGREWLLSVIEEWLNDNTRLLLIQGKPGSGKSAIAAWLSKELPQVVGVHFCTVKQKRSLQAMEMVSNLVAQLSSQIPEYRQIIQGKKPERIYLDSSIALRELVIEATQEMKEPHGNYLLIIDALDEALLNQRDNIVDLLFTHINDLPSWLRIIATSQPRVEILDRGGYSTTYMNLQSERNREDVSLYLENKFKSLKIQQAIQDSESNENEIKQEILKNADGNFLYVRSLLNALEKGEMDPNQLPRDVLEYFYNYFQKNQVNYPNLRPILEVMFAAQEPLNLIEIATILDLYPQEVEEYLSNVYSIFTVREGGYYQPYHGSLVNWLTGKVGKNPKYQIIIERGQKRIIDHSWKKFKSSVTEMSFYSKKYLPYHLLEINKYDRLVELLQSPDYFVWLWNENHFHLKEYWSILELEGYTVIDTYKDILKSPQNYPDNFIVYLSRFLTDRGHYIESVKLLEYALNLVFHDRDLFQEALGNLAWALDMQNFDSRALEILELQEIISMDSNNLNGLQRAYGYRAGIFEKGYYLDKDLWMDEALIYYHQQQNLCQILNDDYWLQISIGNEAHYSFRLGELKHAIKGFREKEKICKEKDFQQGLQWSYSYLADYYMQKDPEKAIKLYYKQLKVSRKIGYYRGITFSLNKLQGIYQTQKEHKKIKEISAEIKEVQKQATPVLDSHIDFNNKDLWGKMEQFAINDDHLIAAIKETQGFYEQSIVLYKKNKNVLGEWRILYKQKRFNEAMELLETNPNILLEPWGAFYKLLFFEDYGDYLFENLEFQKAYQIYEEAAKISRSEGNDAALIKSLKRQINCLYNQKTSDTQLYKQLELADKLAIILRKASFEEILGKLIASMGFLYRQIGEKEDDPQKINKSIELLSECYVLENKISGVRIGLALALVDRGKNKDYDRARELYLAELQENRYNDSAKLNLLELELCRGNYQKVVKLHEKWNKKYLTPSNNYISQFHCSFAKLLTGKSFDVPRKKELQINWSTYPLEKHLHKLEKEGFSSDLLEKSWQMMVKFKKTLENS